MRLKCLILITVLLVFALVLPTSTAQEKTKQEKTKKDEKQPAPLYVKLNVVITDGEFRQVNDLPKDRFSVFENDVPQIVSLFEPKTRSLGYVLAIDTSLSLRAQISIVIATAKLIVMSTPPDEQVMLMRFISSDKIERTQDFTSDHAVLLKAIDSLYLQGGQSAIIDAISLANDSIEEFTKKKENVRRSVIVLTDGEERHSYYTKKELLEQLRRTGTQVVVIAFPQGLQPAKARERAANFLHQLVLESGGNVYYPNSVSDIQRDVKQLMLELEAPYVIGYESTNAARDGNFRKLRVEIENPPDAPKLLAFVRDGFTVPKN